MTKPVLYQLIDRGNHREKSVFFDPSQNTFLETPSKDFEIKKIHSSVRDQEGLLDSFDVSTLRDETSFLDMPVQYSMTLGIDRLVCAYNFFPSKNKTLIIDSGSFTTMDLVTDKEYLAGPILPGLDLLSKSFQEGKNLSCPTLSRPTQKFNNSTDQSLETGLYLSFITPITEYIRQTKPDQIIITGGSSNSLYQELNALLKDIEVKESSMLMFEGLKKIVKSRF